MKLKSIKLKLRHIIEIQYRQGKSSKWVDKFREQVQGRVSFAAFVMGEDDPLSIRLNDQLETALEPPDDFEAVSWKDFPYF